MTAYILVCSGKYTEWINGQSVTANKVELITGSFDRQKLQDWLLSPWPPDVKDPEGWGIRSISIYPVEIKEQK